MKRLEEYLEEEFNPEWDYVIGMASIGYPILRAKECKYKTNSETIFLKIT